MDHLEIDQKPTDKDFSNFWLIDIYDVLRSEFTLVLGMAVDGPLRGALVEAGAAIASGARVICVGDAPCFGTWKHHPLVTHVPRLIDARTHLLRCIP